MSIWHFQPEIISIIPKCVHLPPECQNLRYLYRSFPMNYSIPCLPSNYHCRLILLKIRVAKARYVRPSYCYVRTWIAIKIKLISVSRILLGTASISNIHRNFPKLDAGILYCISKIFDNHHSLLWFQGFTKERQKSSNTKNAYFETKLICGYGKAEYRMNNDASLKLIGNDFARSICKLPQKGDVDEHQAAYEQFFKTLGTVSCSMSVK